MTIAFAPLVRGDYRADCHRDVRVLDLDQQSDVRPPRPRDEAGQADQAGLQRVNLRGGTIRDQSIGDDEIVPDDQFTVLRTLDVAFDCIGAFGSRRLEGRPRVLGVQFAAARDGRRLAAFIARASAGDLGARTVWRSTSVAGSVNTACGNSGVSARCRMTFMHLVGQQAYRLPERW
jgi:hypothetical protein